MKLHSILAAAAMTMASAVAIAHPEGHDFSGPSPEECARLKKLSKEDADKPAMKQLKEECAAAEAERARKSPRPQ